MTLAINIMHQKLQSSIFMGHHHDWQLLIEVVQSLLVCLGPYHIAEAIEK